MRKWKIVTVFCLALVILWFGWVYSKNYRLTYEFKQNRWTYETMAKFMFDNGIMELRRESHYSFDGKLQSSLEYSSYSGALKRECDQFCNLWKGITIENFMIQSGISYVHSKYWTMPFDSLFFVLSDSDRSIGYKKDGWWDIKKWQTTYGGTFEYRIDNNWIILKSYDRDRNPPPSKYDF